MHKVAASLAGVALVVLQTACADRSLPTPPSSPLDVAAAFRDRLDGSGRKVAIQILEFFDRQRLTTRRGDVRRINPNLVGLFSRRTDAAPTAGGEASLVGRPDFKSGKGRETVLGGFDSHSLPPHSAAVPR